MEVKPKRLALRIAGEPMPLHILDRGRFLEKTIEEQTTARITTLSSATFVITDHAKAEIRDNAVLRGRLLALVQDQGKTVVSCDWLHDCIRQGHEIPVKQYIIDDHEQDEDEIKILEALSVKRCKFDEKQQKEVQQPEAVDIDVHKMDNAGKQTKIVIADLEDHPLPAILPLDPKDQAAYAALLAAIDTWDPKLSLWKEWIEAQEGRLRTKHGHLVPAGQIFRQYRARYFAAFPDLREGREQAVREKKRLKKLNAKALAKQTAAESGIN